MAATDSLDLGPTALFSDKAYSRSLSAPKMDGPGRAEKMQLDRHMDFFRAAKPVGLRPLCPMRSYCRETFGQRWRKRFDEDLYEVLTGRDCLPEGMFVHLVLRDPETGERSVHEKVEMTSKKHRALYQRRTLEFLRAVPIIAE